MSPQKDNIDQACLLRPYLLWSRLRAATRSSSPYIWHHTARSSHFPSRTSHLTSYIEQVVKTLGAGADAAKPLIEKGIKEATPYAESAGKEAAQVASKVARDGLRGVLSFLDDFVND